MRPGQVSWEALRPLLCDMYGSVVLEGQPKGTDFWLFVGTDGFSVARLRTGDSATIMRMDLWSFAEAGRSVEGIERSLKHLHHEHLRKVAA